MSVGVYVHVPFCLRKCPYCDFASWPLGERDPSGYVDLVLREAEARHSEAAGDLATLYIGGGTPTALPAGELARLVRGLLTLLAPTAETEVTLEANPATIDRRYAEELLCAGANRLSIGVQSFDAETLRTLGRAHGVAEAVAALEVARGFPRWSLDLILAVPGSPPERDEADAVRALELGARHVSAYCLSFEEGTPFGAARNEGRLVPLAEGDEAERLERVAAALAQGGLARYEVSNWASEGEESRHNLGYWRGVPYVGLGAGAHSWDGSSRSWNHADPLAYRAALEAGNSAVAGREAIGPRERFLERLMLALRTREGAEADELARLAREAEEGDFPARLERTLARGDLVRLGERLRVPDDRLRYADAIVRELA